MMFHDKILCVEPALICFPCVQSHGWSLLQGCPSSGVQPGWLSKGDTEPHAGMAHIQGLIWRTMLRIHKYRFSRLLQSEHVAYVPQPWAQMGPAYEKNAAYSLADLYYIRMLHCLCDALPCMLEPQVKDRVESACLITVKRLRCKKMRSYNVLFIYAPVISKV